MAHNWASVWAARRLPSSGRLQDRLLTADGFDTAFGRVPEHEWTGYVMDWALRLGISSSHTVYEVGCGAGAFLYPLYQKGAGVGGLDSSQSLLAIARSVMPRGIFDEGDAATIPPLPLADFVLANSVFQYFPSQDYACRVLHQMTSKATIAIAVLDLPDQDLRDQDIAMRVKALAGTDTYASKYSGLEHRYYSREWISQVLSGLGLQGVSTLSQSLPGYANAPFRFNVWGFKPPPDATH
jgi:SAM-dependent methyltransferase